MRVPLPDPSRSTVELHGQRGLAARRVADRARSATGCDESPTRRMVPRRSPRSTGRRRGRSRGRPGPRPGRRTSGAWQGSAGRWIPCHEPDAIAAVIGEEHPTPVRGRERAAGLRVEGEAGGRRAASRAGLAGDHVGAVAVRVDGSGHGTRALGTGLSHKAGLRRRSRLASDALVARPAEVLDRGITDIGDPVDLLPGVPADVPDPQLVRAGADVNRNGLRRPYAMIRACWGRSSRRTGCPAKAAPVDRVHPEDRAVEGLRLAVRRPSAA